MFNQKENYVCFFWAFAISVSIRALNYLGLMANQCDSNHHKDIDEVEDAVLTKVEFHEFHEEIQQFCEESRQDMHEIRQVIATLLSRKSSNNNIDQYIWRHTPKYNKIPSFDGEMRKLDFIDWLLDLQKYFNFWKT